MHRKEIDGVRAALDEMAKTKEGNAFTGALAAAREKGDKTFTVAGKEYKTEDYNEAQDGEEFKPHMMYDPKTGKGYKCEKPEDHERMKKMGYTHEKPDMTEDVGYPHMMYDPKTGKSHEAKTPADHKKYADMGYTHEKPDMAEATINFSDHDGNDKDFKNLVKKMKLKIKKAGDGGQGSIDTTLTGDPKNIEKMLQTMYGNDWKQMYKVKGDKYIEEKANKKVEDASNDKSDDGDGMDKVDPKAAKKKFADRKDKDLDNDGDTDSSDEYLHKKRKAIGKAMAKEETVLEAMTDKDIDNLGKAIIKAMPKLQTQVFKNRGEPRKIGITAKGDEDGSGGYVLLNINKKGGIHVDAEYGGAGGEKDFTDAKSAAKYIGSIIGARNIKAGVEESTIRERLTSIWEDAAGAKRTMGATDPEPMTKDDEHSAKKMKAGHKIDMHANDKDDSEKAEKITKPAPARNGDKKDGEKAIKPSATPDHPANKSTKEQFDALRNAYAMVESMDKIMTVDIDHTTGKASSFEKKMGIKIKPNKNGQSAVDATGKKGDLQKYLIKHYGGKSDAMSLHPEIFKK